MNKKKGQMTLELIILIFMLMVVFLTISFPLMKVTHDDAKDIANVASASLAVRQIANAVDMVGVSGVGAKTKITVKMPMNISEAKCEGKTISITVNTIGANITNTTTGGWINLKHKTHPGTNTTTASTIFEVSGDCSKLADKDGKEVNVCLEKEGEKIKIAVDCWKLLYSCYEIGDAFIDMFWIKFNTNKQLTKIKAQLVNWGLDPPPYDDLPVHIKRCNNENCDITLQSQSFEVKHGVQFPEFVLDPPFEMKMNEYLVIRKEATPAHWGGKEGDNCDTSEYDISWHCYWLELYGLDL
jgi:uncharacterized protein (UPF0333 family)